MNNTNYNRRPQTSVSSPQFAVSNVAEFFKFNRRRRTPRNDHGNLIRVSRSSSSPSSSQQQGHYYSFAAGVLAASKNFRPFNPSFSRRGRNTNSNNKPRESRQMRHNDISGSTSKTKIPFSCLPRKDTVISFAAFHDTYSTLGLYEYTEEEISNTWYSREALATIERDRQRCIRLLEKNESLLQDIKYSSRGLEKMTRKGQENYDRNRQLGLDVVFEEQENILKNMNNNHHDAKSTISCDPDIIAASYRAVTIRCHKEAHKIAKKELLANQSYLISDNIGHTVSSKVLSRQAIIMSATTTNTANINITSPATISKNNEDQCFSNELFISNQSLLSSASGCGSGCDSSQHQIDICSVTHSDGSIASAA